MQKNKPNNPLYQGKLDIFCAAYAVLNGMRLTNSLSAAHAKIIFNETLLYISEDPKRWRDVVWNDTDFVWLVEWMFSTYGEGAVPLRLVRPWEEKPLATPHQVWRTLDEWCGNPAHTAVFRFKRFLPFRGDPIIRHWSAVDRVMGDVMFLYDSSKEDSAVLSIEREGFTTTRENVTQEQAIMIDPCSVFLIAQK